MRYFATLILLLLIFSEAPAAAERYEAFEGTTVAEIRIIGANNTQEYIILRELFTKAGEPFDPEKIKKDFEALDRLGIFSEVKIYPIEENGGTVIIVEVTETFRYLPVISVSIDDENGISAGAGLKSVNMFGRGVYLSAAARFGGAMTVETVLRNPWVIGNHFGYEFMYFHRDRRNELFDFDEVSDEFFLTLSSYIRQNGRIGGGFSHEIIRSDVSDRTISPDNKDNVSTIRFFAGYDSRDLVSNPSTGWWNEVAVEKAGLFGEEIDFWRAHIDIRRFIPVADRHTIALFSLASLTDGVVGETIAPWQQYSLGGTNTIRGWHLGSKTGKNQFINTLEYRYTLLNPRPISYFGLSMQIGMHLAVFADVGTAWTLEEDFRKNFLDGYGIGIRFIIPYVGLARLDFGVGQPSARIQVHLGSYEKPVRQRDRVR
jgi:outer membrane protein insertion porin family